MSSLTSWAAALVDLLDNFHGTTNPLDTNFQGAVHEFKNVTEALMGSGTEAFSGQAPEALQQAVVICLARDQAVIDANVLSQATKACTDFAQKIDEATSWAERFVTDETILAEVLAAMSIFQAAQYGSTAIPLWIAQAAQTQMNQAAGRPPGAELAALNAQNTLQALEGMADTIHSAVPPWEQALDGDVTGHAGLWDTVQKMWQKAQIIFEILEKTLHNDKFKSFADAIEKDKGSYLAALGFLLTILANPPKNPDVFMRELYGSALNWATVFIPGLGETTFALEIVHQFGPLLASGQDAFAAKFSQGDPGLLAELQDPATGMREGAEKIEVGSVFNDLGAFLYDGSSMYTNAHGMQQARQAELGDLRNLRHDTWKVMDGTWQFSTNLIGGGLDDLTTLVLGQNDPGVVQPIVHDINVGTRWVASLPDKVEHDWSWIASYF